jgi:hypothetical protein
MHKSHKLILLTIGIVAILALSLTLLPELTQKKTSIVQKNPETVILKVGQESIYQKDLDYEISKSPRSEQQNQDNINSLKDKLINDSITLQQAEKDKLIKNESKFYNSISKDYLLRIKTVDNVKNILDARAERIQGNIVTIWFHNLVIPQMGIEKAKVIVKNKIDLIYSDVKSNKITIAQAVNKIKTDTSLKEIDSAYAANAEYKFNAVYGDKITIDKEFDDSLWLLKQGELTAVQELKGTNMKQNSTEGVLYAFGIVEQRTNSGDRKDYQKWLEESTKLYEVAKY